MLVSSLKRNLKRNLPHACVLPLISLLLDQRDIIPFEHYTLQYEAKQTIRSNKARSLSEKATTVRESLYPPLQKLFDIANERGSSTWLSVLPLKTHGYHLHKGAFWDGLCLRYGWEPPHVPDTCVCGFPFSAQLSSWRISIPPPQRTKGHHRFTHEGGLP